jgi:NADH dehydrogenase
VIPTDTVIWAAGVKANPLADALGLAQTPRGEIVVEPDLTVPGRPEVFVIGDLASVPKISEGRIRRPRLLRRPSAAPAAAVPETLPQIAPVAMQAGRYVAKAIVARQRGREPKPFRYVNKGIMATIGRRSAVAELPLRIHLGGTLGWLSWLGLHLVFLIGFRNRVVVLVNWAWNYVKWDRGNRLILADPDE